MGIISVLMAGLKPDSISVTAWVLSCRVFGYGIETAKLNTLRRLATRLELATIAGLIIETSHNQPCRDVFSWCGIKERNGGWLSDADAVTVDPEWLTVTASGYLNCLAMAGATGREAEKYTLKNPSHFRQLGRLWVTSQ